MSGFAYLAPRSLEEAVAILAEHGEDAHVVAGGTSFALMFRRGLIDPGVVVGLRRVPGLDGIERAANGSIEIGAMTSLRRLERDVLVRAAAPELARVVGRAASVRVRNQATLGGNLAHADPAHDPPPILIALDASAVVAGPGGSRTVPIAELFVDVFETVIGSGEILTRITFPQPSPASRFASVRFAPRTVEDVPTVGVAVRVDVAPDGRIEDVRIALGAVAATPLRARLAEDALRGRRPSASRVAEAAALAADASDPATDIRGSAGYKRRMIHLWTARMLSRALVASGVPA